MATTGALSVSTTNPYDSNRYRIFLNQTNASSAPVAFPSANGIGVAYFNPASVATLEFWFDAADTTTITSSGTTLISMANKGTTAGSNITVHAGTPTTGILKQNNLNLIGLPTTTTMLKFTGAFPTQVRTRFFAYRPRVDTTVSGNTLLYQNLTQTNGNDYLAVGLTVIEVAQGQLTTLQSANIANQQNSFIVVTFLNASTSANNRLALTGAPQALTGSSVPAQQYNTASATNYINAESLGAMELGEFLSFNSELTLYQAQQVEGYLAWKWGAQASLPADHPFKLFPPTP